MSDSNSRPPNTITLQRVLGLGAGMAVSMGVAIGAGIFRNPGEIAGLLPNGTLIVLAWIVGGLLTLVDSLVLAELSTCLPKAGGWYVYLREAYGDFLAFIYGWSSSLITYPGSIAAVAVAIGEYVGIVAVPLAQGFGMPIQYGPASVKAVAVSAVVLFTVFNLAGLKAAAGAQKIFTTVKVVALLVIVGLAFAGAPGAGTSSAPAVSPAVQVSMWVAFGLALQFVVWTYDGYADVITLAEELRDPRRDLPRALLGSIGALTVLYVVINLAFLYVLSPAEMAGAKELVAAEVVARRTGSTGKVFLAVLALIVVVGGLNAHLLSGPRITFAMARDGLSFKSLASVTRRGTPVGALLLQSACAVVLTLTGTFESLIVLTIFIIWMTNALNTVAVFLFRRRFPETDKRFLMPGYPLVPLWALIVSGYLLVNMIRESRYQVVDGWNALGLGNFSQAFTAFAGSPVVVGIVVIAVGFPVYWIWKSGFKARG